MAGRMQDGAWVLSAAVLHYGEKRLGIVDVVSQGMVCCPQRQPKSFERMTDWLSDAAKARAFTVSGLARVDMIEAVHRSMTDPAVVESYVINITL